MPLTSVVYFIACGLLILTLIPVGKGIGDSSLLSPNWIIGIRVFSISTFIFLGVINYATLHYSYRKILQVFKVWIRNGNV